MVENIPFPPDVKLFSLRADLADELCLWEGHRRPIPKKEIDEFLEKIGGVTRIGLALARMVNEDRRHFFPRRFNAYYTAIGIGAQVPAFYVTDGVQTATFKRDLSGLVDQLIERAAGSQNRRHSNCVAFLLDSVAAPATQRVLSTSAVLHDTAIGSAAVVSLSQAFSYVRTFRD